MDLMSQLHLTDVLHGIAGGLMVPVALLLVAAILFCLYSLGTLVMEAAVDRRRYRAVVPELVARIDDAPLGQVPQLIEGADLLREHKDDLLELVNYLYLPEDARTEVAKRLLRHQRAVHAKTVGRTESVSKLAPMLGLMGTLIPLGLGLLALSTGDTETLSSAMLVAFDTTTAGLACAVVAYLVTKVRRTWYQEYLENMDALMNTLLEKARILHERGYRFDRRVYSYDEKGRTAHPVSLDAPQQDAGEQTAPAQTALAAEGRV